MSEVKAFLLRIRTAFAFGGRLKNALILFIAWNYFVEPNDDRRGGDH
jgi:hypothetical protein